MRSGCLVGVVGVLGLFGACGDDGGSPGTSDASSDAATVDATIDAAIDAPSAVFSLTSPTITMGMPFPVVHTCDDANTSPALAWTNPPAGTMSFVVMLTDTTNNLVHSGTYDIPGNLTGLPADVDKVYAPPDVPGAHQPVSYVAGERGYNGPCPQVAHTYQFKIYAIGTATLPGATMSTTRPQIVTAAGTNLGTATLTATYTP